MNDDLKAKLPRFGLVAAAAIVATASIGGAGYWLGVSRAPAGAAAEAGRAILYWYDPMLPNERYSGPGQSSMGMDLIPRYADEVEGDAGVRIASGVAQNLGIRVVAAERAVAARSVMGAGVIAFSERSLANVQARSAGFVERTYGRAVGDVVQAGAPLIDVRVPEWAAAQAEYLALRGGGGALAAAARQRLANLGMPAGLIERVEREGAPRPVATITAPVAGAITALDLRAGMTLVQGAPVASINGLSPVWLIVSLPQADAGLARRGERVSARVPAYPGVTFNGRIESVLPAANAATRSVEVRIALANADGRLRPGMTAEAVLSERASAPALMVPAEAVIRTGLRSVVIAALDNGRYAPVEVELGRRAGDRIEIVRGLNDGQKVVASGQFLIDSEANLSGALARLDGASVEAASPAAHQASGRVTALGGATITIAHGAVASLQWPAMTMTFALERPELARSIAVGETVSFRFRQEGSRYVIVEIGEAGTRP